MRILKLGLLGVLILIAVLVYRTAQLQPSPQAPAVAPEALDETAVAAHLAGAVQIPTISYADTAQIDGAAFTRLIDYLRTTFPHVDATLQHETINGRSLLYIWPGQDAAQPPALFLAHLDVVPVEPGTEAAWTHPPFSGDIADGYIWGRGAIDDKASAIAWFEALDKLAAEGFQPRRTLMFAFGHDEEIGGVNGAQKIAALLHERGLKFEFALDEGGVITRGVIPGVRRPVASIMAAEKGYASFRLNAHSAGGHSSMPPRATAVGALAAAVARLQAQPMPARLAPPTTEMLDRLAPEMPLVLRVAIANRWLFSPLLIHELGKAPVSDALLRTTTAPTLLRAGIKDNVLPSEAEAIVNFRLLPGDTVAGVTAHIRSVIADPDIAVEVYGEAANEASPVADTRAPAFALLARSVNEVFPDAVVSSGLVIGTTDLRNYAGLYDNRYNFVPTPLAPEDLARIHGTNERIGVADYANIVRFYLRLLRNLNG